MSGTDRPDEAVHTFLGRPGRQRSTRTLTDHLHPRPARPATKVSLERADRAPTPPRPALSLERSDRARRPAPAPTPAPTPTPAPASASARPATPPPAPAAVGQARASERRIVLDDDDPVLTIPAAERSSGTLRFTLQWEQQITSSGLHRSSDVHLGCFWETRDRHAGALQSLGDLLAAPGFGARQVLRLGPRSEQGGEEVLADAAHLGLLRRMVFFVYPTGSQAPDYANLAPRLTIARRGGGAVEAWTHAPPADARTAVIASLHDVGGDLVVRRENEFFPGPARDVALAYGFDDLEWNSEGTVPRSS